MFSVIEGKDMSLSSAKEKLLVFRNRNLWSLSNEQGRKAQSQSECLPVENREKPGPARSPVLVTPVGISFSLIPEESGLTI